MRDMRRHAKTAELNPRSTRLKFRLKNLGPLQDLREQPHVHRGKNVHVVYQSIPIGVEYWTIS